MWPDLVKNMWFLCRLGPTLVLSAMQSVHLLGNQKYQGFLPLTAP